MGYKTLRALYYGNENEYKNEYQARLNSENTYLLDFEVSGFPAFFVVNDEVSKLMIQILRCDKEIFAVANKLPKIASEQYSKKCLIDEIVLTNKIEGVHSSRKEIGEALALLEQQSEKRGKRHRFVGLVNKYAKLLSNDEISLSTCQDVRDVYDEVFLNEVVEENAHNAPDGKIFRKDPAAVHSATDKIIHEGLTPEKKIVSAMEKALAFLNDTKVEDLYRFCIFHYMLEYIHPFYDGNGRLGRFIFSYCISRKLEGLLAYRISETIKEHVKEYYEAFEICNDPHNLADLTPFLLMMLQMLKNASEDLKDSLTRKDISWGRYEKAAKPFYEGDSKLHSTYSVLIQAALFSETGISVKEIQNVVEISYGTAKSLLSKVRNDGLLIETTIGRKKYYQINLQRIDIMMIKN